jgi:dolichol-phosphate mannosyltransferase
MVVLDADLQDPPNVIAQMVELWRDGYDVVYGVRVSRSGETGFKLWTAKLFYRIIDRISEIPIPADTGDFRLMDKKVVRALLSMPERDRFLRGMASWVGFRQIGLPYQRASRLAGTTKYPLLKMIRFAIDGIVSFSFVPLRLVMWAGMFSVCLAFAGIIYAILARIFTTDWVRGWASIFVAILFLGGVQLISLGIIGEYLGRVYTEVKRRPLYVVEKKAGFDQQNPIEKY